VVLRASCAFCLKTVKPPSAIALGVGRRPCISVTATGINPVNDFRRDQACLRTLVSRHHTFHRRFWLPAINDAAVVKGLRIHDLRHTCAALIIAQGAHPKQIQMHLGHSSITVTIDRYGHLFPDHMEGLLKGLEETFQKARVSSVCPERLSETKQLRLVPDRSAV
jgi:hypothetical protein